MISLFLTHVWLECTADHRRLGVIQKMHRANHCADRDYTNNSINGEISENTRKESSSRIVTFSQALPGGRKKVSFSLMTFLPLLFLYPGTQVLKKRKDAQAKGMVAERRAVLCVCTELWGLAVINARGRKNTNFCLSLKKRRKEHQKDKENNEGWSP